VKGQGAGVENLFYLILLLGLGKASRYLTAFPENTATVLNRFVIYICFPATILLRLNSLDIQPQLLALAAVPWVLVGFSIIAVNIIGRYLSWDNRLTGAVMLCVGLGNTSFFGFPAVSIFLGPEYLSYAIIYDQLGTFLALSTFGTITAALYGNSKKISAQKIVMQIITFPPFAALIAGLLCMNLKYPASVLFALEVLSAALVPVVTFSVGSVIIFRQPAVNLVPIGITLFLKMIICPLIAFVVLKAVGIHGPVFDVSIFEAGMPSMVMAGIIASAGNLRSDVANAAIGYGIFLSFLTLPLIRALLWA
jgi:predicted permease